MEPNELNLLLNKYLKGISTEEERAKVHGWYDSFPDQHLPEELEKESTRKILEKRLLEGAYYKASVLQSKSSKIKWFAYSGIAAAMVLILLLTGLWYQTSISPNNYAENQIINFKNQTHSLLKKTLPDRSEVWLHPGTSIQYPSKFSAGERRVKMSGEVFFSITPNKRQPFIIESDHIETLVWGTSFRVRDLLGSTPEVNVATGLVSVKFAGKNVKPVVLRAHEKAAIESKTGNIIRQKVQSTDPGMTIWRKVNLSFSDTPVSEVIDQLNQAYDCKIMISSKVIASYQLSADFSNENLANVLDMMCRSLNITYTIKGNVIQLINS